MRKLVRLLFRLFLFVLVVVTGIMTVRTIAFSSRQIPVEPVVLPPSDPQALERFVGALQIPTISYAGQMDSQAFLRLDSFLRGSFPLVDSLLEELPVEGLSKLYKWPGRNPDLQPILLMGHFDVVPVEASSESRWTHPPFAGMMADGFIWGRGTIDDKNSVLSILEAVSGLLKAEYQPERSVYLAFGHDEEIGGDDGAAVIAAFCAKKKIRFEYVLDEGQFVMTDVIGGLHQPLAMIGIAEKGNTTLTLTAQLDDGGHSALPPEETAVGMVSKAIYTLERQPFPARIDGATGAMFAHTGPEMSLPYKVLFANLWLTEGLLINQLQGDPAVNALIRTTTAPTMLRGGVKENVLPTRASAKVNFRILPGETVESVADRVRKVIDDDRIVVANNNQENANNPSPISDTKAFGYQVIQKTIQQVFTDAVVTPSLVIGATDSRHFVEVTDQTYRFSPILISKADAKRFHGIDERISVENYQRMIGFYQILIRNSCK